MLDLMNNPKITVRRVINDVRILPYFGPKLYFLANMVTICDENYHNGCYSSIILGGQKSKIQSNPTSSSRLSFGKP